MTQSAKQRHTLGPWTAEDKLNERLQFSIKGADGFSVCGVDHRAGVFSGHGSRKDAMSRRPQGQSEAWLNATLIAAAPELLDALTKLVDRNFTFFMGGMVGSDKKITSDEILAARAAIAKATGNA
jgi:hypothetical protein